MAEMMLSIIALAGLVHAAPQGLNLAGAAGAAAGGAAGAGLGLPVGAPAVPTSRIPSISITIPTLPVTTAATAVVLPLPIVSGAGGAPPAVPSVAVPGVSAPVVPSVAVAGISAPAIPSVAVSGVSAPGLPSVAVPGISAPGLPSVAVPGISAPGLPNAALPDLPTAELPAASLPVTGLPALPSAGLPAASLPGFPSAAVPSLPVGAIPAASLPVGLPPVPVDPTSALPALLQASLPTGSILPVDIKTMVPLANPDIISALATLPANAGATSAIASALAAVPTSGLPALSAVPTGILPGGVPELTASPDVNSILEGVTTTVLVKVMSAVAAALAQAASALGGSALPTPSAALPSDVFSAMQALPTGQVTGLAGAVPTGLPAVATSLPVPTAGLPNVTLPGRVTEEAGESDASEEEKEKRQLPGLGSLPSLGSVIGGTSSPLGGAAGGLTNPLAGVQGAVGSLTSGAGLGSAVGGLTANNAIVNNVANAVNTLSGGSTALAFLNPLLGNTGGLAGISAVLDGTPIGGIINNAGIPSMVLSTTKDIPILAPMTSLTSGVKSAGTLPLTDLLSGLPVLGNLVRQAISTMNTFGLYNVDPFTQLIALTNVAALQTTVQFINPKDLALASYILGSEDVLSSNALGSLLTDPTQLVKAISAAAPVADNLPAVGSMLILGNLGAAGIQNLVPGIDSSAVSALLAKLPVGILPTLPTGALTGASPVKE